MLEVSQPAAEVINAATAAEGVPDTGGLRIFVDSVTEQGATLTSTIAASPDDDDQILTSDNGARVFLEPDAALYVNDKVLDVEQDSDGQSYLAVHGRV